MLDVHTITLLQTHVTALDTYALTNTRHTIRIHTWYCLLGQENPITVCIATPPNAHMSLAGLKYCGSFVSELENSSKTFKVENPHCEHTQGHYSAFWKLGIGGDKVVEFVVFYLYVTTEGKRCNTSSVAGAYSGLVIAESFESHRL